jgi:hypothetical protein
MRRLAKVSFLSAPFLMAALLPAVSRAEPLPLCPKDGPQVCFTEATASPPVTVPGSGDTAYVRFTATVENQGGNTATHPAIKDVPPATGMKVFSISGTNPDDSAATCDAVSATCFYEKLPAGSRPARFEVVMSVDASAPAGTPLKNQIQSLVDEGPSDSPNGGKQDTTVLTQEFSLLARDGRSVSSFVPAGLQKGKVLTTDQDGKAFAAATLKQPEVATTEIPLLSQPIFAGVSRTSGDPCPAGLGQCAMPDWMDVHVPDFAASSSKFLKTTLRLDSSLLLKGQNAGNVVLYYQPVVPGPIQTLHVSRSCVSAGCFTATKEKDGDLTLVFSEAHNGRMKA